MGGFIAQLAKTIRYRNLPSHRIGEYQMDFMLLFSLRLRVFAVNELLPQDTGMDLAFSPPALGRRTVSTPFL